MTSNRIKTLTTSALLCAIGILIPQVMPRIVIGPASFTLASHVAVILAMFISPFVGIAVALITTFGFLLTGLPMVIVLRALSHLVFVTLGALILKKFPNTLQSPKTLVPFALLIAVVHAIAEVIVASLFLYPGSFTQSYVALVFGFVGIGTMIHSCIDFAIAIIVWIPVQNVVSIPANARVRVRAK